MLGGLKRSGKDTVADVLVRQYGFVRLAFADPLKRSALLVLRDLLKVRDAGPEWFEGDNKDEPIGVPLLGRSADASTPRVLLEWLGTDLARNTIAKGVWTSAFLSDVSDACRSLRQDHRPLRIVVSDLRFPNEANAAMRRRLRSLGLNIVRTWRIDDERDIPDLSSLSVPEQGALTMRFDRVIKNVKCSGSADAIHHAFRRLHGAVHDTMRLEFGLIPDYPDLCTSEAAVAASAFMGSSSLERGTVPFVSVSSDSDSTDASDGER